MAYGDFAYYYDFLNGEADYEALAAKILSILAENKIENGILADLGCGTGELTMLLRGKGYELIAIDSSPEMLSVFQEKLYDNEINDILLLNQKLGSIDLYGTINAAISTFDTLNHLPPQELARVFPLSSMFMEKGGIFIFDANTPYKHREILANNVFEIQDDEGLCCKWSNKLNTEENCTDIQIQIFEDGQKTVEENFREYIYSPDDFVKMLVDNSFEVVDIIDGESFLPLSETSQRLLFTARKI